MAQASGVHEDVQMASKVVAKHFKTKQAMQTGVQNMRKELDSHNVVHEMIGHDYVLHRPDPLS